MLYKCHRCGQFGFRSTCPACGLTAEDQNVPLDPEYYQEFQYRSQGRVKDLFVKKKAQRELQSKLDSVLEKYHRFEKPYFVNFVYYAGQSPESQTQDGEYTKLDLFQNVLVRLGFAELVELPALTEKLVRTTRFRFDYRSFAERAGRHVGRDSLTTLRSWIEEQGSAFRVHLPLFLYFLWEQGAHTSEIRFAPSEPPLVKDEDVLRLRRECENIYFDILVERFKLTLEQFDPSKFVTIYAIDVMDGHQFEEFLHHLFATIGFDVQLGKRTADQGADLFAQKFGRKIVIQAKNYTDSVGNSAVQQVLAAKVFYGCDDAMVITSSYFTPSAKALAEAAGVKLVDRTGLQVYLDDFNQMIVHAAASERAMHGSSGTPAT